MMMKPTFLELQMNKNVATKESVVRIRGSYQTNFPSLAAKIIIKAKKFYENHLIDIWGVITMSMISILLGTCQ
jgi:hypothetical protein